MLKNLKIGSKLQLLSVILITGIIGTAAFAYMTINFIKVNGPIYKNIILGKDLVADILPPPEYIIESYLTTLEMTEESDQNKLKELENKMIKLEKDYETRHEYWIKELPEVDMKEYMTKDSYEYAKAFYAAYNNEFVKSINAGDKEGAHKVLDEKMKPSYERHREVIDKIVTFANMYTEDNEKIAVKEIYNRIFMMLFFVLVIIVISVIISVLIGKNITVNIEELVKKFIIGANGDLTIEMQNDSSDEIGVLSKEFNNFLDKLNEILSNLKVYSYEVGLRIEELSGNMESIEKTSENFGDVSRTTAAATEEMSENISSIAENSRQLTVNAEDTSKLAEEGGRAVKNTIMEMKLIKELVEFGTREIRELGEKTNEIVEIITVINDIAAQTNLLALNAAIEAARAGEAGKGFEVVAEEVRKLAEKTTDSTKEIIKRIKEIQTETKGIMVKMEEVNSEVEEGVTLADNTGDVLEKIVYKIGDLKNMIGMIATSTREQSNATNDISHQTQSLSDGADETVRSLENSTRAIREISAIVENINKIVCMFTLKDDKITGNKGCKTR